MKYDHTFEIFGQTFVSSTMGLVVSAILTFGFVLIPAMIFLAEVVIPFFFSLAEKTKNKYKAMQHQKQLAKQIDSLIAEAKGKFFALTFIKQDGTVRTINGKDKYNRLISGKTHPATAALKAKGYKKAVNRNRESWVSFMPEKVVEFKCGTVHKTF
jgi:hypothetical protein